MRLDVLVGGLSGSPSGLSEPALGSYEAQLKHLWMIAEQLRPVGNLLASLGPAAPPCLAIPYMEMRDKLQNAADALLSNVKARGTADQWAQFEQAAGGNLTPGTNKPPAGPIAGIFGLPELTTYWKAAPAKWWMGVVPSGAQGGLGVLYDAAGKVIGAAATSGVPVLYGPAGKVIEAAGAFRWATAIWEGSFFRCARAVGTAFARAANVLLWAYIGWEAIRGIYNWFHKEAPPETVTAQVNAAIAQFNDKFVPEVVQQLRAVCRVVKSAGVNSAKVVQGLLAADPANEKPVQSLSDAMAAGGNLDGDEVPIGDQSTVFRPSSPWAALGVLVFGSFADLALARYG